VTTITSELDGENAALKAANLASGASNAA